MVPFLMPRCRLANSSSDAATLDRLTPEEAALYADLRYDRLGRSVRLEQERIPLTWLRPVLRAARP